MVYKLCRPRHHCKDRAIPAQVNARVRFTNGGFGDGLQAVPPAPSVGAGGAGGNSDHGGRQMAMDSEPGYASATVADD